MLEIKNLHGGYSTEEVLHGVDLEIPAGKITVLAGPNGCGKSTLLKAIAGLIPRTGGEILLDSLDLGTLKPSYLARQVAYLAQCRRIPEITALNLVLHGRFPYLSYPRRYGKKDEAMARQALETMGIPELADRSISTLSGGQRQKVYIAMALVQDTPVVLLDEPTTYLDIRHQFQLMEHARFLAASGRTVVLVLHDLTTALGCADHLVVMDQGRVLARGTPEEVYSAGVLERVFGVRVERVQTPEGWQYYYGKGE